MAADRGRVGELLGDRDLHPADVRQRLQRKLLASNRHRARVARMLKLRDNELAAITCLADRGPLTPTQLGEMISLSSGGVTTLAQRLERLGYIERHPHPRDKRSCVLRVTPSIVRRTAELFQPLADALDELLAALPADDRERLGALLDRVSAVIERETEAILSAGDEPAGADRSAAAGLWC